MRNTHESAMRETPRHLLFALIYSLGIAGATGFALMLPLANGHVTLALLVAHLVSGALAVIFLLPFLYMHLREGRALKASGRTLAYPGIGQRLFGYGLACCATLTLFSGLFIATPALAYLSGHPMTLPLGSNAPLILAHLATSLLLVVLLLLHFPKKVCP